ncbi:MAG: prepilin-type N-terminal cleavage/methylation domain-containing protein [Planctomycetaceae bacterium]|nr:prepilin-type N-terminal cleavage/methylation domain-containing protein [Planctomycetaceae bacterium]
MNSILTKSDSRRTGFTLIELLVAVSIFLILTALTIGTFSLNIGSERIGAAGRIMQAKFEGARSRAFGLSQQSRRNIPVGVRFILDENNPTLATGIIFVEGVQDVPKGYLRFVNLNPGNSDATRSPNDPGIQYLAGRDLDNRSWSTLLSLGLLRPGVSINIDNRYTYRISSQDFLPTFLEDLNGNPYGASIKVDQTTMKTVETPVEVDELFDASDTTFSQGYQPYEYELDLTTISFPMAGEEIENLPKDTVIDLQYSKIPSTWSSIQSWSATTLFSANQWVIIKTPSGLRYGNALRDGTSGGSQPNFDVPTGTLVTDGGVLWRIFDTLNLDIMFNPNGSVNGVSGAEGVLFFLLAERVDTDRDLNLFDSTQLLEVKGSYRVVTLYTNSGVVLVSPADLTDSDSTNGVDDLFRFAREGAVAK